MYTSRRWVVPVDRHFTARFDAGGDVRVVVRSCQGRGHTMDGWGPSAAGYLRIVFANEPVERLAELRDRFHTALG